MKTAEEHILKLYSELKVDKFTYSLVKSLMESYARENAIEFSMWEWESDSKSMEEQFKRRYTQWINQQ